MKFRENNRGHARIVPQPSRRRFVQGVAAGGIFAGLGLAPGVLLARSTDRGGPQTLRGNEFDLSIAPQAVNFTGSPAIATAINGAVPAPVLRWREGDEVTLRVANHLAHTSSIHWHGIILPTHMDGVPGISYPGIRPGETFVYRFRVSQAGTYWYHSHSGFQEQTGMYGAIVIDPRDKDPIGYDRDHVVMLSDWTDEDPNTVYAKLKKLSHYYNRNERTVGELVQDIRDKGIEGTWRDRGMWNRMRMSDRDLSDVTGYTYTFLMNGQPPGEGWVGLFQRGERVRLRFINASSMTFFDLRIPGLKMTVVAADGQNVEPVTVDEIRMGVAETFDVVVEPEDDRAYTLFAQAIDRSGFARGTLTPDPALRGEVPAMDPVPLLTHMDMGMDMGMMGHHMAGMDHGDMAMDHGNLSKAEGGQGMDHGAHALAVNHAVPVDHAGHAMGAPTMAMDHGGHTLDHAGHSMPMNHGDRAMTMDHGSASMQTAPAMGTGEAGFGSSRPVRHPASEYGPQVDMHADGARYRLDDPGVGLRNNGRRVLTYADLRNLRPTPDPREPGREIQLHLTGNMSRYMWSMDGIKFADAEPLQLKYGERVRITLVNDTMMNHPIHLHGMWSDLETGDSARIPRKHTVVVQPGAKISYLVAADAMGGWAYHCHLLYHMLGMFRKVVVS
jgi:CopA family copper-resistance protein